MYKILIMGLPGAGKTTLATTLAPLLNAVVFNADAVRANLSRDLGFSHEDRIEHARRMGWMCDRVVEVGGTAIADFVCPTEETRAAFGEAFTIWVDRIRTGRFDDTNKLFTPPARFNVRVTPENDARYWAERVLEQFRPALDLKRPAALCAGERLSGAGGGCLRTDSLSRNIVSFPLFTSIKPPSTADELSYLRECINSWRGAGFRPIAINGPSEIEKLHALDLAIDFAPLPMDGKPRIGDFIAAARASGPRAGIINSDCRISIGPDLANRLSSQIINSIVLAWRVDIDHAGELTFQRGGFDAFFFDTSVLPDDDCEFHIAEPWWDYWFPLACEMKGAHVETLSFPILVHRFHIERWNMLTYAAAAKRVRQMLEAWKRRGDIPETLYALMTHSSMIADYAASVGDIRLWLSEHRPQTISIINPEFAHVELMFRYRNKIPDIYKDRYEAIRNSRSWRITAPLRQASTGARMFRAWLKELRYRLRLRTRLRQVIMRVRDTPPGA